MGDYQLIIFDCDGTLVDSEYLNNKVSVNVLNDFGLKQYTTENFIKEFAGTAWSEIKKVLDKRHNLEIPQSVIDDYIRRVQLEMETTNLAVAGALDVVDACSQKYKIAVGSNGERSNVLKSLQLQGFMTYFSESTVFTKIQVANPKPAPDLFLFAAEKMGVESSSCLVIEDSPSGAAAGVAAGMEVWGFTGVAHDKTAAESKLNKVGVKRIFDNFIHIGEALKP